LTTGDYVVIRNMSVDYEYLAVTVSDANTFTVTVADSGGGSGTDGAYIPAADATSVTDDGATINSPTVGDIQILSLRIVTGTKSGTTFDLTMPASLTNGGGANSSLTNQNPPQVSVFKLSDGAFNAAGTLEINTSSNFNIFTVGSINQLVNNVIRFNF